MIVQNMTGRSGRPVVNQFIINNGMQGEFFQSYNSIVAISRQGVVTLDRDTWQYSRTTMKYLSKFLGESMGEIRRKVESGLYTLADLN